MIPEQLAITLTGVAQEHFALIPTADGDGD